MTAAEPVRAVLLDAFGTLLDLEAPAPLLRELLAQRLGVKVTEAQAASALAAEIAYYRAHMAQGIDALRVADLHLRCAEVLRGALPASPALLAADPRTIVGLLLDSLRFRAYPEVPGTLEHLRQAGLALVVVSNWDATLDAVLDRVGILAAVDAVVSSAVAGAAKPDPLPLRLGLELAGVAAAGAIHVGDGPDEDVAGAIAAGIRPVLIRRESGGVQHDQDAERYPGVQRIAALDELVTLLAL
jgi:putative hydrolase of the HAD superfamily